MDISKLAYELYKIDWKKAHWITPEIEKDSLKNYYECLVDFDDSYLYKNYIEEFGYNGELYVCFEEFLDCEYQDKDYIRELFDNEKLFEEYLKDC